LFFGDQSDPPLESAGILLFSDAIKAAGWQANSKISPK
jgi:hypothetical protein